MYLFWLYRSTHNGSSLKVLSWAKPYGMDVQPRKFIQHFLTRLFPLFLECLRIWIEGFIDKFTDDLLEVAMMLSREISGMQDSNVPSAYILVVRGVVPTCEPRRLCIRDIAEFPNTSRKDLLFLSLHRANLEPRILRTLENLISM